MQQSYEMKFAAMAVHLIPQHIIKPREPSEDNNAPEYNVFVSHSWGIKEFFVDEFVQALRNQGLHVWYDATKMKWSDSMRAKIDEGLRHSRFGVVVLSTDFFLKESIGQKLSWMDFFSWRVSTEKCIYQSGIN